MKILYEFNLLTVLISIAVLIIFTVSFVLIKKHKEKKRKEKKIESLDYKKNILDTYPITSELSKVETIIKNEDLEEQYREWEERFQDIKENNVKELTDLIVDLDTLYKEKKNKEFFYKEKEADLALFKAKFLLDKLLDEIEDINLSEEKYRTLITKLKAKYRALNDIFNKSKAEYGELQEIIEMQFENIERRFKMFEEFMQRNEYNEVVHIVKSIDMMIDHMTVVVDETPDIILMAHSVIPLKIKDITNIYKTMTKQKFNLESLEIPLNMKTTVKRVNQLIEQIKRLNFTDVKFELITMIEYLDKLYEVFEEEKLNRFNFGNDKKSFEAKLLKTNKLVSGIYRQLDDIKDMYNLKDDDLKALMNLKLILQGLNESYKNLILDLNKQKLSYKESNKRLKEANNKLNEIDKDLDIVIRALGNMYEDEQRAREQLNEIEDLLKETKTMMKSFKFPSVDKNYYVELKEANDAIKEVIKELEQKPIKINTLNTRVDTARDLALKVYNNTKRLLFDAETSERLIIYANKYRSTSETINERLNIASNYFFKGEYEKSLDLLVKTLENVIPDLYDNIKLMKINL